MKYCPIYITLPFLILSTACGSEMDLDHANLVIETNEFNKSDAAQSSSRVEQEETDEACSDSGRSCTGTNLMGQTFTCSDPLIGYNDCQSAYNINGSCWWCDTTDSCTCGKESCPAPDDNCPGVYEYFAEYVDDLVAGNTDASYNAVEYFADTLLKCGLKEVVHGCTNPPYDCDGKDLIRKIAQTQNAWKDMNMGDFSDTAFVLYEDSNVQFGLNYLDPGIPNIVSIYNSPDKTYDFLFKSYGLRADFLAKIKLPVLGWVHLDNLWAGCCRWGNCSTPDGGEDWQCSPFEVALRFSAVEDADGVLDRIDVQIPVEYSNPWTGNQITLGFHSFCMNWNDTTWWNPASWIAEGVEALLNLALNIGMDLKMTQIFDEAFGSAVNGAYTVHSIPMRWAEKSKQYFIARGMEYQGWLSQTLPDYDDFQSPQCPSLGNLNADYNDDGTSIFNVVDIVNLANCVLVENCGLNPDGANAGNDFIEYGCAADLNGDTAYNVLDIVILANCVLANNCSG